MTHTGTFPPAPCGDPRVAVEIAGALAELSIMSVTLTDARGRVAVLHARRDDLPAALAVLTGSGGGRLDACAAGTTIAVELAPGQPWRWSAGDPEAARRFARIV
ncbi:MAG: hypothetical protein HRU70_09705 [Phycisphaeraceae bacterium]|nr:MAG: hypothetical protein HRU70_09705 [Phycisphaeraceae bacterium]